MRFIESLPSVPASPAVRQLRQTFLIHSSDEGHMVRRPYKSIMQGYLTSPAVITSPADVGSFTVFAAASDVELRG